MVVSMTMALTLTFDLDLDRDRDRDYEGVWGLMYMTVKDVGVWTPPVPVSCGVLLRSEELFISPIQPPQTAKASLGGGREMMRAMSN